MCFVDLEKAFDHVPQGVLSEVLREYGVLGPLLQAVQSLYKWSKSLVCIVGCKSDSFSVRVGWLPFVTDSVHNIYGQNF